MTNTADDGDRDGRARLDHLAGEVAALRSRIDRTESVLAIHALKSRYADLVDRRYRLGAPVEATELVAAAEAAARLFTEDGTWDGGPGLGRAVGRQAIAERLGVTTLVFARHFFVSPLIEVDEGDADRARGRWELLSPCRRTDGRDYLMGGVEDDEYQRVDGAWLHRSMRLTTVFMSPYDEGWGTIYT